MGIETKLIRDSGHPHGIELGWDGMFLWADSEAEFYRAGESAQAKFWRPWIVGPEIGTGRWVGYFYKPSGQDKEWEPALTVLDFWRGKPWEVPARKGAR